jgi:hypothetical protein
MCSKYTHQITKLVICSLFLTVVEWSLCLHFKHSIICRIWGSHSGDYEDTIFWDITPYRLLRAKRCFGGTYRLHHQGRIRKARHQFESLPTAFKLVSCSVYLTMKREAIYSSETSVTFNRLYDLYPRRSIFILQHKYHNFWQPNVKNPTQFLEDRNCVPKFYLFEQCPIKCDVIFTKIKYTFLPHNICRSVYYFGLMTNLSRET